MSKEQQNDVVEELVADETVESQETAEAGQNEAEVVDARYAELEKQLEESQQRYLRTQADFDNFRRRSTKEEKSWRVMRR